VRGHDLLRTYGTQGLQTPLSLENGELVETERWAKTSGDSEAPRHRPWVGKVADPVPPGLDDVEPGCPAFDGLSWARGELVAARHVGEDHLFCGDHEPVDREGGGVTRGEIEDHAGLLEDGGTVGRSEVLDGVWQLGRLSAGGEEHSSDDDHDEPEPEGEKDQSVGRLRHAFMVRRAGTLSS